MNVGVNQDASCTKLEVQRLLDLVERTGCNIMQEIGQRIYGTPRNWVGGPPPKESEVFVGELPRNLLEDELVPFMERAGMVYEIRLMMSIFGGNRGYAFVTYSTPEEAAFAVRVLNGQEIRIGWHVGVVWTDSNHRLFISGIPNAKNQEEVYCLLREGLEGVDKVVTCRYLADRKKRGFVFLDFKTNWAADFARRKLLSGRVIFWEIGVLVDWAEPEIDGEDHISQMKVLFVENIAMVTSVTRLVSVFQDRTHVIIERAKLTNDFAFVHYASRKRAKRVKKRMHGYVLDGSTLVVTWPRQMNIDILRFRMSKEMEDRDHQVHFDPVKPVCGPAMTYENSGQGTAGCTMSIEGADHSSEDELNMEIDMLSTMLANISIGGAPPMENQMTPQHR